MIIINLELEQQREGMTVGEYVYETIKKNIVNMNITPGTRISENEVSELLNISRTPVREAFIKLSREKLVYILPQRGTYISYIDLEEVEEARFIRESLESSVIKLATEDFPSELINDLEENLSNQRKCLKQNLYGKFLEYDEEFHETIFTGCNKARTWSFIQQVNTQYKRARLLTFIADSWHKVVDDHEALIEAIKEKDQEKGLKIIIHHVKKLLIEQVQLKEKYPQYFK